MDVRDPASTALASRTPALLRKSCENSDSPEIWTKAVDANRRLAAMHDAMLDEIAARFPGTVSPTWHATMDIFPLAHLSGG
jgi:hypothetical protein